MKARSVWYAGSLGGLLLLVVGAALPGRVARGQELRPQETARGGDFFVETFDGPTLAPEWFWVREDPALWNLAERPGWLRIYTQYGSLDGGEADNVLLRAAPAAPYTLSSHFEFNPTLDSQEAALLVYIDDDNYIKISRLEHAELGGSSIFMTREVNGVKQQGSYVLSDQTDISLRLAVYPYRIFGWYLDTAGEWRLLGVIQIVSAGNFPYVGLTAHNGITPDPPPPSIPADFDYIEAGEGLPIFDLFLPAVTYN